MLCTCVDGDRCSLDDAGGDQTLGLHGELVLSLWLYCHQGFALVPKLSKHLLLKWWQWAEIDFWIPGMRTRMGIQNCNSTFRGCDEKNLFQFFEIGNLARIWGRYSWEWVGTAIPAHPSTMWMGMVWETFHRHPRDIQAEADGSHLVRYPTPMACMNASKLSLSVSWNLPHT